MLHEGFSKIHHLEDKSSTGVLGSVPTQDLLLGNVHGFVCMFDGGGRLQGIFIFAAAFRVWRPMNSSKVSLVATSSRWSPNPFGEACHRNSAHLFSRFAIVCGSEIEWLPTSSMLGGQKPTSVRRSSAIAKLTSCSTHLSRR